MHDSPYTLFTYHVSSNLLIVVLMSLQVFVLLSPKKYGPVSIHAGQTSVTQHSSYTAMWEDTSLCCSAQTEKNFGILPRRTYSLAYWVYG
jgi:hypothetical protein